MATRCGGAGQILEGPLMTGRERILCAYRGGKPDRTPVAIRGVYPFNAAWVARKHASYKPLIDYVREYADIAEIFPLSRGFLYSDDAGLVRTRIRKDLTADRVETTETLETPKGPVTRVVDYSRAQQLSMVRKAWVETDEDLARILSLPFKPHRPDLKPYFAQRAAIGERGICLPELSNAVGTVHDLLGTERLAVWSLERREDLVELLELFNARLLDLLDYLLEAGVGPVIAFNGEELITPPVHGPRDFDEFVVAYDRLLVERIHARGALCRIHCHGRIGRLLDGFLKTGVDAIHPVEEPPMGDITLEAFRRRVGTGICVKGGVQIGDLYAKGADEVTALCRKAIHVAGTDGALVLAPSASPYWPELTPAMFENYRAMIDSVK